MYEMFMGSTILSFLSIYLIWYLKWLLDIFSLIKHQNIYKFKVNYELFFINSDKTWIQKRFKWIIQQTSDPYLYIDLSIERETMLSLEWGRGYT